MEKVAHKTTLSYLNKAKCESVPIPLPFIDEQRTIAAILRACDEKIATLEREAAAHDELFKALLEQLMAGQLRATELIDSL